jgi:hypothetical protein
MHTIVGDIDFLVAHSQHFASVPLVDRVQHVDGRVGGELLSPLLQWTCDITHQQQQ